MRTSAYHDLTYVLFFIVTESTEVYTLSLHDALPISSRAIVPTRPSPSASLVTWTALWRSEEHTSELQSRPQLVCRLLLEKKNLASVATVHIIHRHPEIRLIHGLYRRPQHNGIHIITP